MSKCHLVKEGLAKYVDWYPKTHIIGEETDVSFEMIGDNLTTTLAQVCDARMKVKTYNNIFYHTIAELDSFKKNKVYMCK